MKVIDYTHLWIPALSRKRERRRGGIRNCSTDIHYNERTDKPTCLYLLYVASKNIPNLLTKRYRHMSNSTNIQNKTNRPTTDHHFTISPKQTGKQANNNLNEQTTWTKAIIIPRDKKKKKALKVINHKVVKSQPSIKSYFYWLPTFTKAVCDSTSPNL